MFVQVILNNVEYQPGVGSNNKKMAKLQAAQLCLEKLGLMWAADWLSL